ncbi:unnamed protein product [Orchesella dallaii]|uniref:Uncharacterized protein n=1 Tax=Orchesella dallaii TaxID=48710 RepID=A0ABP1QXS9_9HEXA
MHLKWALYALLIVFTTIKACKNNSSCQECLKDQTGCVFYQNSKDSICTAEKISSKPYILKVRSMEKCPKLGKMSTTNPELVHTTNSSRPTTPREYPVDQTPSVGGQIHKQPTPGTSAETIRRVVRPPIVKRRFTTPRSTTLPTIEHHFTVSTHKPTRVFRAVEPTHESATKTTSQHILLMVTPTPEPTTKATSKPPMNKYHMRSATSDPKPTTILLQPLNSSMTVDLHSASKDIQLICTSCASSLMHLRY